MRQQTVLILDSQQHRGGILEHGLTSRGFHVFRTTRSREASKLLHVLQPHFLVISLEGDGRDFYQKVVLPEQVGTAQCIVISSPGLRGLRPSDATVDVGLPSAQLLDEVVRCIQEGGNPKEPSPQQNFEGDQTQLQLRPFDPNAYAPSSTTNAPPSPSTHGPETSLNASLLQAGSGHREWAGTLDKLDVARILAILTRQQASGRLDLHSGHDLRSVWMERGTVIQAHSEQPVLSLAMMLVQDGVITQRDVDHHPEFGLPDGARLLLEMGKIQQPQVAEVERWYIEQLLLSSFQWQQGGFHFHPGNNQEIQHIASIPIAPLILQGVREGYDLKRLSFLLGGGERVPQWFANRTPENFLPLQGIEKQIVNLIDGNRSLDLIRGAMRVESRLLFSLAYVLMILGYIRMRESGAGSYSTGEGALLAGSGAASSSQHGPSVSLAPTAPHPIADPQAPFTPVESSALNSSQPRNPPAMSYRSVMPAQRQNARPGMQLRHDKHAGLGAISGGQQATEQELQEARDRIEHKFTQAMMENYFQVLELTPEALEVDIRRAYQRIKHTFATERFVSNVAAHMEAQLLEIQQVLEEAYAVLGDPQLRFRYMSHLAEL